MRTACVCVRASRRERLPPSIALLSWHTLMGHRRVACVKTGFPSLATAQKMFCDCEKEAVAHVLRVRIVLALAGRHTRRLPFVPDRADSLRRPTRAPLSTLRPDVDTAQPPRSPRPSARSLLDRSGGSGRCEGTVVYHSRGGLVSTIQNVSDGFHRPPRPESAVDRGRPRPQRTHNFCMRWHDLRSARLYTEPSPCWERDPSRRHMPEMARERS